MIKVQRQLTLILEEIFTYSVHSILLQFLFVLTRCPRGAIRYDQLFLIQINVSKYTLAEQNNARRLQCQKLPVTHSTEKTDCDPRLRWTPSGQLPMLEKCSISKGRSLTNLRVQQADDDLHCGPGPTQMHKDAEGKPQKSPLPSPKTLQWAAFEWLQGNGTLGLWVTK